MERSLSFAEQLKHKRILDCMSQEDVANVIGCSTKTIARWEAGKSSPRPYHRQKISEFLAKSVEDLGFDMSTANDVIHASAPQKSDNQSPSSPDTPETNKTNASSLPTHVAVYQGIYSFPPPTHPATIQQREQDVHAIYMKLIQPDVSAVVLTGIGGVGKSTLAALVYRFVLEHRQTDAQVFPAEPIWLTINERVTMVDVVGTLFTLLGKSPPALEELTPSSQVMALLHALNTVEHARLIVLDQFENVLDWQTGYALSERPGIGAWVDAMNSQPCACKLLLTSRMWPQGTRIYPPAYMQEYKVSGLDIAAGSELLRKQGIEIKQASKAQLRKAVSRCDGHALALILLASLLRQNRSLNLSLLFRDPLYMHLWDGNIAQELLDFMYFKHLNDIQRQILFALAIYREAVPLDAVLALVDLRSEDRGQIVHAVQALVGQCLVQAAGNGLYNLHAVVNHSVKGKYEERNRQKIVEAHNRAAHYYLQQAVLYCPPLSQRKYVNDVELLIEAVWHMCLAERWQEAYDILHREELYQMLRKWGENTILLELYQLLLPSEKWTSEPVQEAEIHDHLGRVYAVLGKKELALQHYERSLQIYNGIEVCRDKGRVFNHLGLLYESMGQEMLAKNFHEQALVIARETKDDKGEADSLTGLGWIYHRLGQQEEALHCCMQALHVHHEIGNLLGEGDTLNALGLIYYRQGKLDLALQFYMRSLSIRKEIGNRGRESKTLNHLGLIFAELGQLENAQEYYRKSLIIRQEVGDRRGEGIVLYNLSKMYFKRQYYDVALGCMLLASKIFKGVQTNEYKAIQGWIETLQNTVGQKAFADLLENVEQKEIQIIEQALKNGK
jgi:tetratricopeptide (TPR) repeat protein/transcriptional regulator with XRE-family HTH domain